MREIALAPFNLAHLVSIPMCGTTLCRKNVPTWQAVVLTIMD